MVRVLMVLLLLPGSVFADDWKSMDGAEIAEVLTDQTVIYENATQRFYASGRTLYSAGQDSWGYWVVRDDQYCSQWPPGDQWDCYDIAKMEGMIRFIGIDGSVTDGMFAP
ncbi:hypothetical protein QTO30_06445 [Yoonia sp. GPGPB17]|uniref:hypothetical protein n=1 Tax=Yoonia sp. GPGPB17 TaxID=3026147 RepID=UPI0030BE4D32